MGKNIEKPKEALGNAFENPVVLDVYNNSTNYKI